MTRFALLIAAAGLAAGAAFAAAPAPSQVLMDFCVTPDGICPLPRPAPAGTPCSCRWPKGNVSQGQAGE